MKIKEPVPGTSGVKGVRSKITEKSTVKGAQSRREDQGKSIDHYLAKTGIVVCARRRGSKVGQELSGSRV